MKKINVRFEKEKTLNDIEIVIRADKRDEQINALIEKLTHNETVRLTVLDMNNCPSVIDEKEIVFVSADGKNVQFVTVHGKYRAKQCDPHIGTIQHEHHTNRSAGCHGPIDSQIGKIQYFIGDINADRHDSPDQPLGNGSRHRVEKSIDINRSFLRFFS